MRTRTAPSERPRTPAISAVDISSTKRRTSARRRSSGSRPTAAQASAASSRRVARASTSSGRGDERGGLERRLRPAPAGAAHVGDDVPGDLEQPDPERRGALAVGRPGPLLEAGQRAEREQERPLGGVLGVVMVAELVVGVAVHLGEVLPIEGVEPGRVAQGGLDERSVAVEMDEPALPSAATFLNTARAIALHPDRSGVDGLVGEPQVDDLAAQDGPLAVGGGRIADDEATGRDVDAERPDDARPPVRPLEPDRAGRS